MELESKKCYSGVCGTISEEYKIFIENKQTSLILIRLKK